jgi:hypothetical protein
MSIWVWKMMPDRLRNGNYSNVAVSSGSGMENLVNSVLQQIMGAYTQSGRPNQRQSDEQLQWQPT